ncbi:serine peptidase [Marinobacter sp. X15-166B]|nr:serine peptidase [Marinobacter sp. X15-166B]
MTGHSVTARVRGAAAVLLVALFSLQAAAARELPDFTALVEQNSGAVVNISTTQQRSGRAGGSPFSDRQLEQLPEFFQDFFRGPQAPFGRRGPESRPEPMRSMGSGFIVSADGYVLTNNHVIDGADEIVVRLSDRRELMAKLVGTDPRSDLAVLKIEHSEDLPVVKIGRSSQLRPGQWVFAIGSPFGFDHTVTAGIISAVGRSLPSENYVPFIQTDVAINPGNSGGPLFNLDGEVIGINSQIYTRSGGFMGVSFAIPMDDAMNVFRQIRDHGTVARGWLGVLIQEVNRDLAESFGLKRPRGALIAEVLAGSPAQKAGLRSGDIVLSYDGEEISLSSDLPPKVGRTPVDEAATLTILRDGKRMKLDVVIGRLPEDDGAQVAAGSPAPSASTPLGLKVGPLTAEQKDALNLEGGVLVTGVAQGPALQAGIRPNDVITELNRQSVQSVSQFNDIAASLPKGKAIPVRVVRQGQAIYLVMKP